TRAHATWLPPQESPALHRRQQRARRRRDRQQEDRPAGHRGPGIRRGHPSQVARRVPEATAESDRQRSRAASEVLMPYPNVDEALWPKMDSCVEKVMAGDSIPGKEAAIAVGPEAAG